MKNLVSKLCCKKSLLLVLTLLCGAGQGYAGGNGGGQSSRLVVASLSKAMPELKHLQYRHKSEPLPLFKMGIFTFIGGSGLALATSETPEHLLITALGGGLAICGALLCVSKAIRIIGKDTESRVLKAGLYDIVIYESDGEYQLAQIDGKANKFQSDNSVYTSHVSITSADGMQDLIEVEQVKHVMSKDHFQMLANQQNSEQNLLKYLREVSHEIINNAVIAFRYEDNTYLKTFSGVSNTDDGGVELIMGSSGDRVVISVDSEGIPALVDSEGIPVLDGELHGDLKGMIFLP